MDRKGVAVLEGEGYENDNGEGEGEGDRGAEERRTRQTDSPLFVRIDEDSVCLPSGEVLVQRSYRAPCPSGNTAATASPSPFFFFFLPLSSSSSILARRYPSFILARPAQRCSPRPRNATLRRKQRAVLAMQMKQLDKSRQTEQWIRCRVERKGNKTLIKHFVNDVPGGLNS
ncbi:hypothetical protein F5B21DRAFT_87809 [Xylaria acuta]|nr:hypothetical protein F5B21DRAFT_87809 [Xylaria acuta]